MRNTADVIGGKPIAVLLQSISDVRAINPLVAFYDIHGRCAILLFCPGHQGLIALTPETDGDRLTTCHVCSIPHS
jgi:hypothetical protein